MTYPDLTPLFPVLGFAPGSPCPHGVLPRHTKLVCAVCHRTGRHAEARIAAVEAEERRRGVNQPEGDPKPRKPIRFRPKARAAG